MQFQTDDSGNVTLPSDLTPVSIVDSVWAEILKGREDRFTRSVSNLSPELAEQRSNAILLSNYKAKPYQSRKWPQSEEKTTSRWFAVDSPKLDRNYCRETSLTDTGVRWNGSIVHAMDTLNEEVSELAEQKARIAIRKTQPETVLVDENALAVAELNRKWLQERPWENNVSYLVWEAQEGKNEN